MLRPYGIKSTTFRVGDTTPKGYLRADFNDAWARYLGGDPQQAQHPQHHDESPDETRCGSDDDIRNTIRNTPTQELWADVADVADVADDRANGANNTDDDCPACAMFGEWKGSCPHNDPAEVDREQRHQARRDRAAAALYLGKET